jgi:hypothetical protein
MRGETLNATLVSDRPDAARNLERSLGELHRALSEHGITAARLTVLLRGGAVTAPRRDDSHGSRAEDRSGRDATSRETADERARRHPRQER